MKKLKFIAFALVSVLLCVGFTACGDDDKDEPGDQSIVGTWAGTIYDYYNNEEDGEMIADFDSDGTCYISSNGDAEYATYTYSNSRLIVSYSGGYKWRTTVTWNSSNSITLDDNEGERITLTRQ